MLVASIVQPLLLRALIGNQSIGAHQTKLAAAPRVKFTRCRQITMGSLSRKVERILEDQPVHRSDRRAVDDRGGGTGRTPACRPEQVPAD
jgi:hypothetical protein